MRQKQIKKVFTVYQFSIGSCNTNEQKERKKKRLLIHYALRIESFICTHLNAKHTTNDQLETRGIKKMKNMCLDVIFLSFYFFFFIFC